MANKKIASKNSFQKKILPLIIAAAALIIFAIVFTTVAITTSRASRVVGKTYEVTKVKVTVSAEEKQSLQNIGMSVSDLSDSIAKEVKGAPVVFSEDGNDKDYKIDGSRVTITGVEYKRSFGKLIGEMKYSDGITVKVVLKEKK